MNRSDHRLEEAVNLSADLLCARLSGSNEREGQAHAFAVSEMTVLDARGLPLKRMKDRGGEWVPA